MAKSKRKRVPKTVLKLPDLEQSKSAFLNSLTSPVQSTRRGQLRYWVIFLLASRSKLAPPPSQGDGDVWLYKFRLGGQVIRESDSYYLCMSETPTNRARIRT